MAKKIFNGEPLFQIKEHFIETYLPKRFRFIAQQENSTIRLDKQNNVNAQIVTSFDGKTWTDYSWNNSGTGNSITLQNIGDKVYFRAKTQNQTFSKNSTDWYMFKMTGNIIAKGNIMFLLNSENPDQAQITSYCFAYLFYGCTSLAQAPELPATTLATYCYNAMFQGCTSLAQAPELPATTLVDNCYINMFNGCSILNDVNVNFSAWNASNATKNWLKNVSSSGTFTCPFDLQDTRGIDNIPQNWNIVRK